jgi:RING-type zinc-finger
MADLQCSICLGDYEKPVTWSCGHTFCSHCTVLHASKATQANPKAVVKCPLCQEPRQPGSLKKLKVNRAIQSLVEAKGAKEEAEAVDKQVQLDLRPVAKGLTYLVCYLASVAVLYYVLRTMQSRGLFPLEGQFLVAEVAFRRILSSTLGSFICGIAASIGLMGPMSSFSLYGFSSGLMKPLERSFRFTIDVTLCLVGLVVVLYTWGYFGSWFEAQTNLEDLPAFSVNGILNRADAGWVNAGFYGQLVLGVLFSAVSLSGVLSEAFLQVWGPVFSFLLVLAYPRGHHEGWDMPMAAFCNCCFWAVLYPWQPWWSYFCVFALACVHWAIAILKEGEDEDFSNPLSGFTIMAVGVAVSMNVWWIALAGPVAFVECRGAFRGVQTFLRFIGSILLPYVGTGLVGPRYTALCFAWLACMSSSWSGLTSAFGGLCYCVAVAFPLSFEIFDVRARRLWYGERYSRDYSFHAHVYCCMSSCLLCAVWLGLRLYALRYDIQVSSVFCFLGAVAGLGFGYPLSWGVARLTGGNCLRSPGRASSFWDGWLDYSLRGFCLYLLIMTMNFPLSWLSIGMSLHWTVHALGLFFLFLTALPHALVGLHWLLGWLGGLQAPLGRLMAINASTGYDNSNDNNNDDVIVLE